MHAQTHRNKPRDWIRHYKIPIHNRPTVLTHTCPALLMLLLLLLLLLIAVTMAMPLRMNASIKNFQSLNIPSDTQLIHIIVQCFGDE